MPHLTTGYPKQTFSTKTLLRSWKRAVGSVAILGVSSLAIALAPPTSATAQVRCNKWLGRARITQGLWDTPGNWSENAVPSKSDNVCLSSPVEFVRLDISVRSVEALRGVIVQDSVVTTIGYENGFPLTQDVSGWIVTGKSKLSALGHSARTSPLQIAGGQVVLASASNWPTLSFSTVKANGSVLKLETPLRVRDLSGLVDPGLIPDFPNIQQTFFAVSSEVSGLASDGAEVVAQGNVVLNGRVGMVRACENPEVPCSTLTTRDGLQVGRLQLEHGTFTGSNLKVGSLTSTAQSSLDVERLSTGPVPVTFAGTLRVRSTFEIGAGLVSLYGNATTVLPVQAPGVSTAALQVNGALNLSSDPASNAGVPVPTIETVAGSTLSVPANLSAQRTNVTNRGTMTIGSGAGATSTSAAFQAQDVINHGSLIMSSGSTLSTRTFTTDGTVKLNLFPVRADAPPAMSSTSNIGLGGRLEVASSPVSGIVRWQVLVGSRRVGTFTTVAVDPASSAQPIKPLYTPNALSLDINRFPG
jgi:hypothetical protein